MTRSPRRSARSLLVAVAAAALAATAACGDGGGGGSSDDEVVRVYSGRHYDLEAAFTQFTEETGIKVEFLTGSDAELRERIAAEGEDTQADVYLTVDAGNLAVAAGEDLFRPVESPALEAAVPAELRDPEGLWFGLSMRARTIVYSTRLSESDAPSTYEELAEPQWKGRVCLRNASNVYTQSLVASLIAVHGEDRALDIVQGWADNAEILANDILILESIEASRCDVGITNHYYLARLLDENPELPVELRWANQGEGERGVHVNISGGGITRHADHPEEAQQLLEWLATEGQSTFVDGNHEYPVNPDVEPEPLIAREFGTDFRRDSLNAAEFGRLNAEAIRLMDRAGY